MEKVRPWCGQPSDRGRLKNRNRNSRGISLLSVAGKILARVMLKRLLSQVVDIVLPVSQCGFRRGRSTIDMIFVARLLQEKCREQSRDLYLAFIDLTKALTLSTGKCYGRFLENLAAHQLFSQSCRNFITA